MSKYLKSGALKEDTIQKTFFEWVFLQEKNFNELKLFHHIPNGGSRNPIEAKKFKYMGVRRGIPDTFLPIGKRGYSGLYIEFKSAVGELSEEQIEIIDVLRIQGFMVVVCRNASAAIDIVKWYMRML